MTTPVDEALGQAGHAATLAYRTAIHITRQGVSWQTGPQPDAIAVIVRDKDGSSYHVSRSWAWPWGRGWAR